MASESWHAAVVEALKVNRISLICHVADRVLAPIIRQLEQDPSFEVVTLTREEEGIGILTGAFLGGKRGALLCQASGLGNTLNALGSLAIPYQIPFPIILSPRGGLHEHNLVQIPWGKAVPGTLAAMDLQMFELQSADDAELITSLAIEHTYVARKPVVVSLTPQLTGGKDGRH